MGDLRFSGHESFQCRNLWLKKGFDFINNDEDANFYDDTAVKLLGVGKNMTTSIRYWLDSFGLREENNTLANNLLSDGTRKSRISTITRRWSLVVSWPVKTGILAIHH